MDVLQDLTPGGELHRYFPEWADRPFSNGLLFEAEHNSYLAGGYAEEFGYQSRDGASVFPALSGDPEASGLWRVQIGCLHPGYPQCPRPQDRFDYGPDPSTNSPEVVASDQVPPLRLPNQHQHITCNHSIIRVGQRQGRSGILWQLTLLTRKWRVYIGTRTHLALR